MSSMVSRRPSLRNHSNEAFWMSIKLGRSRTCFRREKLLRARGATVVLLKMRQPPLTACGDGDGGARKARAEPRRLADRHTPPQPPDWRCRRLRPRRSVAEETAAGVSPCPTVGRHPGYRGLRGCAAADLSTARY